MPYSPTKQGEPFWRLVDKGTGCWRWRGKKDRNGYGSVAVGKTTTTAHRRAYELMVGPVPDSLVLDHLCKVRDCVNPRHLEPVTQRENLMRSPTFQAANAAKTCCLRGHEFTPENTYVIRMPNGQTRRNCKTCRRGWGKSRTQR